MEHEQPTPPGVWRALDDLVTQMVDTRREVAALQARETRLLADAVDLVIAREQEYRDQKHGYCSDLPLREVSSELGAAMRLSDRSVQSRMGRAAELIEKFEATHAAWKNGDIDQAHAHAILDAGAMIADPDKRADYERRVLEAARAETPYRLAKIARVIAARVDPDGAAEQIAFAHEQRSVRLIDLSDDLARVIFEGPAMLAHAIYDRLTSMAHAIGRNPDIALVGDDEGNRDGTGDAEDDRDGTGDAEDDHDGTGDAMDRDGADDTEPEDAYDPEAAAGPADDREGADDTESEDPEDSEAASEAAAGDATTDPMTTDRVTLTTGPSAGTDGDGDTRTVDQKRADILADILLTAVPTAHGTGDALDAIRATVHITVPVLSILGRSKQPALLAGHGPIDMQTAKRLAAGAPGWNRVLTDPYTGEPLLVDRYRPSATLKRFLDTRDEHCRFPGCTQPPWRDDHDHTVDAALGGPTCSDNLADFCRRHHIVKHHTPWRVKQLGHGILRWTSPTGRVYVDTPVHMVQFVPDPPF